MTTPVNGKEFELNLVDGTRPETYKFVIKASLDNDEGVLWTEELSLVISCPSTVEIKPTGTIQTYMASYIGAAA